MRLLNFFFLIFSKKIIKRKPYNGVGLKKIVKITKEDVRISRRLPKYFFSNYYQTN